MVLCKLHNFSEPQFPHPRHEGVKSSCLLELLWELSVVSQAKRLPGASLCILPSTPVHSCLPVCARAVALVLLALVLLTGFGLAPLAQ